MDSTRNWTTEASTTPADTERDATRYLSVETIGENVWLVTLTHAAKRNALSIALLAELESVLAAAQRQAAVRAVVLTGGTRYFSAGADIADMVARGVDAYADPKRLSSWRAIERFSKPLVAAVHGFAIGGGNELMMLADIVVAAEDATFSQREILIGALPGDGATQRLTRVLGKTLAMKMVLLGEPLSAWDAERHGLVTEVTPPAETLPRALAIAKTLSERAPIAVQLAKRAVLDSFETPLAVGLALEHRANLSVFDTADRAEGHRAFIEKRPPRFEGR